MGPAKGLLQCSMYSVPTASLKFQLYSERDINVLLLSNNNNNNINRAATDLKNINNDNNHIKAIP